MGNSTAPPRIPHHTRPGHIPGSPRSAFFLLFKALPVLIGSCWKSSQSTLFFHLDHNNASAALGPKLQVPLPIAFLRSTQQLCFFSLTLLLIKFLYSNLFNSYSRFLCLTQGYYRKENEKKQLTYSSSLAVDDFSSLHLLTLSLTRCIHIFTSKGFKGRGPPNNHNSNQFCMHIYIYIQKIPLSLTLRSLTKNPLFLLFFGIFTISHNYFKSL